METVTETNQLGVDQVSKLRTLAMNNQVFNAMAHVFAMRERTRSQITVQSIFATMKKEGYSYTKDQYRAVLTHLAEIKLGRLEKNASGKPLALKDIKFTLQSVGLASIAKKPDLTKYHPKRTYVKLPNKPLVRVDENISPAEKKGMDRAKTRLEVKIGYKTYVYDNFPADEIQSVISKIDALHDKN